VEQQPDNAAELNGIAWNPATWPVPALRDAARAVELARKAVAREPKSWSHWDTLGVALYRSGDWDGAAEALARSRELLGKDHPGTAFFLALARWRQGDRDEARAQFRSGRRGGGRARAARRRGVSLPRRGGGPTGREDTIDRREGGSPRRRGRSEARRLTGPSGRMIVRHLLLGAGRSWGGASRDRRMRDLG
jgi:hypothetical protein